MRVSPEQADQEFGPVGNAVLGWLFALTGCAGLTMSFLFSVGSWSRPGHYGIAIVVGLVTLPCLFLAFRAFTRPATPSLRVSARALRGLALLCFLSGAGMLVLLIREQAARRYGVELVLQPWAFGVLAWQVARRRSASESAVGPGGRSPAAGK